jgi:predicted alpha/beta superfamily hydrolase
MGGLISLYMALRHPDVFGFAGALSPSLWFADARIFAWAAAQSPSTAPLRVYLDMGTREGDDVAEARRNVEQVRAMARLLRRKGADVQLVVAPGTHSEEAWARRFPGMLRFWSRATTASGYASP